MLISNKEPNSDTVKQNASSDTVNVNHAKAADPEPMQVHGRSWRRVQIPFRILTTLALCSFGLRV